VEGMVNESICATATYYLDSENITSTHMDFRVKHDKVLQYYGRVQTREGCYHFPKACEFVVAVIFESQSSLTGDRLSQHKASSFSLKDRKKPGYQSLITMRLVDPTRRIVSMANVLPQQLDWWEEAVFGDPLKMLVSIACLLKSSKYSCRRRDWVRSCRERRCSMRVRETGSPRRSWICCIRKPALLTTVS
ncbi:hypothetical protein GQ53DRAFT_640121, partial [Thozetella sp. PMI_491]